MDNREPARPPGSDDAALRLAHALGGLAREIELFKGERGSERVHAARLKLAAAHLTIRTARAEQRAAVARAAPATQSERLAA
jgi:hypothetical protein